MRLWSLHPKYLDPRGLVALWREALLARAVLRGRTKGYRRHPQLDRFRASAAPAAAIAAYLGAVLDESRARGYRFDGRKIGPRRPAPPLPVTSGQLEHEWRHLLAKLGRRSPELRRRLRGVAAPEPHPSFRVVEGPIETWERAGPVRAARGRRA